MNDFSESTKTDQSKLFIRYVSYLISSALGLMTEPSEYGPIRLLFAVKKLIEILKSMKLEDDYLNQLLINISENQHLLLEDKEFLKKFLEEESKKIAKKLS